mmetsp:Transcript_58627/g.117753  ORF Transcript_58627/g.117753 Transcript_58627/m.117753 type:complete len:260 (+) Transcript_58627:1794-2573(+)
MDAQPQIFLHAHTQRLHHPLFQAPHHELFKRCQVHTVVSLVLDTPKKVGRVAKGGSDVLQAVRFRWAVQDICDERRKQLLVPVEEAAGARCSKAGLPVREDLDALEEGERALQLRFFHNVGVEAHAQAQREHALPRKREGLRAVQQALNHIHRGEHVHLMVVKLSTRLQFRADGARELEDARAEDAVDVRHALRHHRALAHQRELEGLEKLDTHAQRAQHFPLHRHTQSQVHVDECFHKSPNFVCKHKSSKQERPSHLE